MEALVSRVRAADVFETSELREVIDEFTICFNNHLKKENHNDLSVSSTSITEFTAICTELFVSLRSQIQYLSEFMSLPDPLSSQSDMGKINEVNELLVKLWSPLLQFVKCYPTSDMILSVHASTLTQSLLDSLAPYLSVFQDSSVLCLSSASVGLIDWSTVFPLVSRLGCIAVFWHQTIASDTLSSLYTVLAFFKGYFNLLQFAVNDSDSGLAELIAKFDGVFAKIHTKSNVTSVSRLIPLRRCLTECLVHGSMNANNYVPSPTVSVLRDVPRHVSYPFQLVGLLMWLLCEICSFELPLYTSISVQPALYNYLSFVDLWVHALGEYCSLGSTLVSDAWVFDLLETVTRDVVSRMHSLASSSQPASNQHSEESSQFSQYSTQFQVEVTQKQQQRSLQLILKSLLQLAIGANIDSVVRDTEIDCHNNTNTSANPSLSHPSTSSSSSCVPAQYLLSAVVRQCAITTQRGIIVSLLITFFSSQGTCTEILNVVVCCLTTLLRVVHKEVVQFFLNEIKSLLSTCASPTNSPDLIRQFQRAYNIHISLYSAYDIETHMELLLCRLPMAALFARHDPDISATLHAMLQTLSDSIQTYSSNQVHTQSGSTDSNKRLHSDMNNTMNASSSSLSSQSQLQLQTKNKANITVSHAISMLLSISSDELCQSRYIRSNAQRSSVSECALLMQTKHTVSAIKLFQLISTTMKYMNAYCTSVAVIDLCRLHRLSTTVFRLCQPLRALFCPQMPLSAADSLLEYARVMMVQVMSLWREINELYQAEGRNQIDRVDQANNDMVATGISTKQVRYNSQYEQLMRTCESCLECACELLLTTAGVEKLWSMSASNNNDNGATDYEGRYRRVSEVVSNLCTLTLGTYSLASHDRTETIQHNTVQTWSFCGRVSTQCGSAILDLLSVLPDTWKVRLKQVLPIEMAPHIKLLVQRRGGRLGQQSGSQLKSQLQLALFIRL